ELLPVATRKPPEVDPQVEPSIGGLPDRALARQRLVPEAGARHGEPDSPVWCAVQKLDDSERMFRENISLAWASQIQRRFCAADPYGPLLGRSHSEVLSLIELDPRDRGVIETIQAFQAACPGVSLSVHNQSRGAEYISERRMVSPFDVESA